MTDQTPAYWVPAVILAQLLNGTIRIVLHPGAGQADGGIPVEFPLHDIPPELRIPNTRIELLLTSRHEILDARRAGTDT